MSPDNAATPSLLAFALVALLSGPLLRELGRRVPACLPLIEGFVIGTIGALSFFVLLPDAFASAGWWAFAAAAAGLVAFAIFEKISHISHAKLHNIGRAVAVVGLIAHMFFDGVALVVGGDSPMLGMGVALHRIPAAIGVWWLVRPTLGAKIGSAVLVAAAVATGAGYLVGSETLASVDGTSLGLFQAFVTGTLLHVLVHGRLDPHHEDALPPPQKAPILETIGALVGVGLIAWMVTQGHDHGTENHGAGYGHRFLDLALETAPALLLGSIMAGAVVAFLPQASVRWLTRGGVVKQAVKGTAFGIPIPICSCGVVPLYQSVVKQGAPPAAAFAFLIATPELGLESILLSVPLLGGKLTAVRLACAVVAALTVALVLAALSRDPKRDLESELKPASEASEDTERRLGDRLKAGLDYGFVEVVGDTAVWILAGLAIAALVNATSLGAWFAQLPPGTDVVVAAVIGLPIYVCASGATPLAAALLFAGLSPGAAIAFLLSGPASNVTTFGVLSKLHGQKLALAFAGVVVAVAIALGFATNAIVSPSDISGIENATAHSHGVVAWGALVVMALAYAAALLRQGPGAFLAPVLSLAGPGHDHDHGDHDHAHDHGHAHAHADEHGHHHAHDSGHGHSH